MYLNITFEKSDFMKFIAIRVSPSEIFYAIGETLDHDQEYEYSLDRIVVPQMLELPKRLSYIRNVLESIITQQQITHAGIRLSETNSKTTNLDRIYIEAVIQEFFSSSSIEKYKTMRLANIGSNFSVKSSEVKSWIENKSIPKVEFEDWGTLKRENREVLLVLDALIGGV